MSEQLKFIEGLSAQEFRNKYGGYALTVEETGIKTVDAEPLQIADYVTEMSQIAFAQSIFTNDERNPLYVAIQVRENQTSPGLGIIMLNPIYINATDATLLRGGKKARSIPPKWGQWRNFPRYYVPPFHDLTLVTRQLDAHEINFRMNWIPPK